MSDLYTMVEHEACGYRWWGQHLPPVGPCPNCGKEQPMWHAIPVVALEAVTVPA